MFRLWHQRLFNQDHAYGEIVKAIKIASQNGVYMTNILNNSISRKYIYYGRIKINRTAESLKNVRGDIKITFSE